ncbi:MAG: YbaB/EbfC family nucleoid-associated protein [Bacteroidota bacterium]
MSRHLPPECNKPDMFGDMLGNMEEMQQKMRKQLAEIMVEGAAGDGAVKVTANANREITNISINREALDWEDVEQVEDLILIATNRALEAAIEKEATASQEMLKDLLPPGMGDLSNLMG